MMLSRTASSFSFSNAKPFRNPRFSEKNNLNFLRSSSSKFTIFSQKRFYCEKKDKEPEKATETPTEESNAVEDEEPKHKRRFVTSQEGFDYEVHQDPPYGVHRDDILNDYEEYELSLAKAKSYYRKGKEQREAKGIEDLLIGPNYIPDPFAQWRKPDGKLYDAGGLELEENQKIGHIVPHNHPRHMKYSPGLSETAKDKIRYFNEDRYKDHLKVLEKHRSLALAKLGVGETLVEKDNIPYDELKKVWDYVKNPDYNNPISTVVFNYDAGTIDTARVFYSHDPYIKWVAKKKYFRDHPERQYLILAFIFICGAILALAFALYDNFILDHTGEPDKQKTYFRSRLLSSLAFTATGVGATLLSLKLSLKYLLSRRMAFATIYGLVSLPLFASSYFFGTTLNYPESHALGKLFFFSVLCGSAGMGLGALTIKRGPGLIKLLVPILATSSFISTSLAISPFSANLEYGVPFGVLCSTLGGLFAAAAVFPAYKSKFRLAMGPLFALTYAGLLLSYQQPYLNNIKFREHYYGTETYSAFNYLFLKSLVFLPLKGFDSFLDAKYGN